MTNFSLRVKLAEKVKAGGVKQSKPTSGKKKKTAKTDAKKPKKPPTAFFYFLYVPHIFVFSVLFQGTLALNSIALVIVIVASKILIHQSNLCLYLVNS